MRLNSLKYALLLVFLLVPSVYSQTEETSCTKETIATCYDQARERYFNQDYEAAKVLFEKVIDLDAKYKQAGAYLKKCYQRIARASIAEKTQTQRLPQEKEEEYPPAEEGYPPAKEELAVAPTAQTESVKVYRIGVGDVLDISVWRIPDLDRSVIVRPDGVISYPLVGEIPAAGLTLTELDQKLTEVLKDYVRAPEISVAVSRFGGTKVILLGEVKGPGVYNVPGGGNVLDVIALAGGFTKDGRKHGAFVIRGGLQNPQVFRLNLARIFKGDFSQNIPVASNDIVYVPRSFFGSINHMLVQINPLLSNTLLGTTVYRDLKSLTK